MNLSAKGVKEEFRSGWRVLLASSIGNAAGVSGLAFYTFGVFVIPLSEAFDWSRGQVASAASFLIIGTAITAPVIGSIIDRFGARRVGLCSLVLLSVGYFTLTQLNDSIVAFYFAWLLMSLVGGGTTPVVWTRAVNIWFDGSRGLALGLTLGGSGLAGIFGPVMCAALIAALGWRGGYAGVGAIILLVAVPTVYLLFRDEAPASNTSEKTTGAETPMPSADLTGLTLQESLRVASFWKIAAGFFFVSAAVAGLIINLVPLLIDNGLKSLAAAQIAGSMGIAVVFGRIIVGLLLDRFHAPVVARWLLIIIAVGCFFLVMEGAPTWLTILSVMSLGLAAAAEVDLLAYLVSRYFGMRSYGKIYGWQLSAFYVGASIGPVLMGVAYDALQSYDYILYTSVCVFAFGAWAIGSLGARPQFPQPQASETIRENVQALANS